MFSHNESTEQNKTKRPDTVRTIAIIIIIALLAAIGAYIGWRLAENWRGQAAYDDAASVLSVEDAGLDASDPYDRCLLELMGLDLKETCAENSDVAGWICIPDTKISYPLVQGEDNDYYLTHTWNYQELAVGSIFADYRNRVGLDDAYDLAGYDDNEILALMSEGKIFALNDFNTIIYGHRMRNGSMFAALKYYNDQEYLDQHPYVGLMLIRPAEAADETLSSAESDTAAAETQGSPAGSEASETAAQESSQETTTSGTADTAAQASAASSQTTSAGSADALSPQASASAGSRASKLIQSSDGSLTELRGGFIYTYYIMPIFSAYSADTTSNEAAQKTYVIKPDTDQQRAEYIADWCSKSVVATGITPASDAKILTLSTCSGGGDYSTRWVVKACTSPSCLQTD